MTKVFVTGGSGFVGRRLISALIQEGYLVKALARSGASTDIVRQLGAEPVTGDLNDKIALQDGMNNCEVVFHLAASTSDWGSYQEAFQSNVIGTQNVLEAARLAGVGRFVHVSTEAVLLGKNSPPLIQADESWPLPSHPAGIYPATKGIAEQKVLAANSPHLTTVIVRPRLVWGKDDTTVLKNLVKAVDSGRFQWIGGGHHLTSTTNVANVCEGLILAAKHGKGGEIYFITDGKPVEMRQFLTQLLKTQGRDPGTRSIGLGIANFVATVGELVWQTFKLKGAPPLNRTVVKLLGEEVTINDSKARRDLGYQGRVTLEEGLAEMKPLKNEASR